MEKPCRVADRPSISSGNISNSDSLDRHPKFIEQPEIPAPIPMLNERGHDIGILMTEDGRVSKILMKDQGGMRGDKFPKGSIPSRGGISRAYGVVPSSDIKGETQLKAKLFSISPEKETSL